jgi:uncharacterized protein YbjT (DUF2867 family)
MMRVALIGATGYVGQSVCARLVADGHHVIRFVREPGGRGLRHRIKLPAAARFLVEQLDTDDHVRTAVCVANQ